MARYKRSKSRIKNIIIFILVTSIIIIIGLWFYNIYREIEVTPNYASNQSNVVRTSNTINKEKDIYSILEKVNKSVVGISKVKNAGDTIFLKDGSSQLGLGTGFIVSENGYIVTNMHVSGDKYSNCYVTLENGMSYTANVVWANEELDLSIIKIKANSLDYIELGDSDKTRIGQGVYAIGNPIGFEFQRTVTSGIISALNRTIKIEENNNTVYMDDLIQTDAVINPGNSGGPLINENGEVIGINSVKITNAEGIGFAIPINEVKPVVEKFKKDGKFEEINLGIYAYDKNIIPYINPNINVNLNKGIYVVKVLKNSIANIAGIQEGDIITKIDNIELYKMCDLRCYIYSKYKNDEVIIEGYRNGQKYIKNITLK